MPNTGITEALCYQITTESLNAALQADDRLTSMGDTPPLPVGAVKEAGTVSSMFSSGRS